MRHSKKWLTRLSLLAAVASVATSCVDHDYDLSKDIDLNVTVGGDLSLPSSNTQSYTMAQILDLSANSSITDNGAAYGFADGDYVLVQDGTPTNSDFSIPRQDISDHTCDSYSGELLFVGSGQSSATSAMANFVNNVTFAESDIDQALVSISSASTEIALNFTMKVRSIDGLNGTFSFQPGLTVLFPEGWTIEAADRSILSFCSISGNKLTFTQSKTMPIGQALTLPLAIKAIDFSRLPADQGLYAPGKFRLNQKIVTEGPVAINAALPAGQSRRLSVEIAPSIPSAEIIAITGRINPEINVEASTFAITDVPDFLKEPGNNLDISNPQIRFTVANNSPVEMYVNARLSALDEDGTVRTVNIGSKYGTDPIIVRPSSTTEICISRTGQGAPAGGLDVAVPALADLIATIPQSITLSDFDVTADQSRDYTFILSQNYSVDMNYNVVVPLAFGPDLDFFYTTDEKGWDEDLEKYSFSKVVATLKVENTVPLSMTPEVDALDRNGNVINDIIATVEGVVNPGKVDAPSASELKVTLTSTAKNIGNLDGVRFRFHATCPEGYTGEALNRAQALRFTDIRLRLVGGVGVDLN